MQPGDSGTIPNLALCHRPSVGTFSTGSVHRRCRRRDVAGRQWQYREFGALGILQQRRDVSWTVEDEYYICLPGWCRHLIYPLS